MFSNRKLEKELPKLYLTDRDFIHKLLNYEIAIPLLSKDKHNNTLLHSMIMESDFKGIDLLLSNIKNDSIYDAQYKNKVLNLQNSEKNTPIHLAVICGLQNVAKKLDRLGVNKTIPNANDLIIKMTETESNSDSDNLKTSNKYLPLNSEVELTDISSMLKAE